jgi:hypothetical protein
MKKYIYNLCLFASSLGSFSVAGQQSSSSSSLLVRSDLLTQWPAMTYERRTDVEKDQVGEVMRDALEGNVTALEVYIKYMQQRRATYSQPSYFAALKQFLNEAAQLEATLQRTYWLAQGWLLLNDDEQASNLLSPYSASEKPYVACALSHTYANLHHFSEAAILAHQAYELMGQVCQEANSNVLLRLAIINHYPMEITLDADTMKVNPAFVRFMNGTSNLFDFAKALYQNEYYAKALPRLEKIAQNGDPQAHFLAGNIYHYGLSGYLNVSAAEDHYRAAIRHRHGESYYELAQLYGEFETYRLDSDTVREVYYKEAFYLGVREAFEPYVYASCKKDRGARSASSDCLYLKNLVYGLSREDGFNHHADMFYHQTDLFKSVETHYEKNPYRYARLAAESGYQASKLHAFLMNAAKRHVVLNKRNLTAITRYVDGFNHVYWHNLLCAFDRTCRPY